MSPSIRVLFALALLAGITAAGTISDELYIVVITLSTVGYGEPRELTAVGRLFTSGFIAVGVGTALYLLSAVAEMIVEGRLRALLQHRVRERRIVT